MVDRKGVIHDERDDLNEYKQPFAIRTGERSLEDACRDTDIFIGVSGPDLLSREMLQSMAPRPVVFALSNPNPEIMPELAHMTRKDLVMATGRSDYPNQINNVLAFPGIFRGALDARASDITENMKLAAARAIAESVSSDELAPDMIVPSVFDKSVPVKVAAAVREAAIADGVSRL